MIQDGRKLSKMEGDRRLSERFAIEREISYRVFGKNMREITGSGLTINMSSRGILFSTDQRLPLGALIELSVSWPAELNNSCRLKLVARGRVVRCQEGRAAVVLESYEFRTAGRKNAA